MNFTVIRSGQAQTPPNPWIDFKETREATSDALTDIDGSEAYLVISYYSITRFQAPQYQIIVYSSGATIFNGINYVREIGRHELRLPISARQRAFEVISTMEKHLEQERAMHAPEKKEPVVTVRYIKDRRIHEMNFSYGEPSYDVFVRYLPTLEEIFHIHAHRCPLDKKQLERVKRDVCADLDELKYFRR